MCKQHFLIHAQTHTHHKEGMDSFLKMNASINSPFGMLTGVSNLTTGHKRLSMNHSFGKISEITLNLYIIS